MPVDPDNPSQTGDNREPVESKTVFGSIILILLGLAVSPVAFREGQKAYRLVQSGVRTQALVESSKGKKQSDNVTDERRTIYRATLVFKDGHGRAYRFEQKENLAPGSTLEVVYDPEDPANVKRTNLSPETRLYMVVAGALLFPTIGVIALVIALLGVKLLPDAEKLRARLIGWAERDLKSPAEIPPWRY